MMSAFGVEHLTLAKASQAGGERARHYGRMATDLGVLGAAGGTVGVGSGIVGELERRDHDPMGFTERPNRKTPLTQRGRTRVLKPMIEAHQGQAKVAIPLAAASLTLAGAYKHKQHTEQRKLSVPWQGGKSISPETKRRAGDVGLGAASLGVGGGAMLAGGKGGHFLNEQANIMGREARNAHKWLRQAKDAGKTPAELQPAKRMRLVGSRVFAVKKPGAILAGTAAAAGGATLLELARRKGSS